MPPGVLDNGLGLSLLWFVLLGEAGTLDLSLYFSTNDIFKSLCLPNFRGLPTTAVCGFRPLSGLISFYLSMSDTGRDDP